MIPRIRVTLLTALLMYGCLAPIQSRAIAPQELPVLGDSLSGIINQKKEHFIGQAWLRALRGQAPTIHDPLINDYLEHLIYSLASHSELQHRQISLIVINSSTINAFAVPGGVVGANAGLLLAARSEDELSAVLAHELAHLSQRHFARSIEKAKLNQWTNLAALLASVIIAASSGNSDAGVAALATTQAAAIDAQLRFSRHNEQEADRIGMKTLVNANRDPHAMPRFFEQLQKSTQFLGKAPPEFLLTHPVTQSRITDSLHRANQLPQIRQRESFDFKLMKMRTLVAYNNDSNSLIKKLRLQLSEQDSSAQTPTRYGLVCALKRANKYDEAKKHLKPLLKKHPHHVTFNATLIEIELAAGRYKRALYLAEKAVALSPNNYPLSVYYAEALIRNNNGDKAAKMLTELIQTRKPTPFTWHLLAESYGIQGKSLDVHRARAEVLFLQGKTEAAIKQLQYALPLSKNSYEMTAKINERISEMRLLSQEIEL